MNPEDIIAFWFSSSARSRWFARDGAFDAEIRRNFAPLYDQALAGRLRAWEETPRGMLALVILLDQIPRNMFRHSPRAFESDAAALTLAETAVAKGFDAPLETERRQFLYMPFMHAESLPAQYRSVALFSAMGLDEAADYARRHCDIIARFGRFPHRNNVLGRINTPEEEAFLSANPGF